MEKITLAKKPKFKPDDLVEIEEHLTSTLHKRYYGIVRRAVPNATNDGWQYWVYIHNYLVSIHSEDQLRKINSKNPHKYLSKEELFHKSPIRKEFAMKPNHKETYRLIYCGYVFTLRIKHQEAYWDIHLKENEHSHDVVKNKIWTLNNHHNVLINITPNNKCCIVTLPNKQIRSLLIEKIIPAPEHSITSMLHEEEKQHRKDKAIGLASDVIDLIHMNEDFTERVEDLMHILIARIPLNDLGRPMEIFEEIIKREKEYNETKNT